MDYMKLLLGNSGIPYHQSNARSPTLPAYIMERCSYVARSSTHVGVWKSSPHHAM